MDLAQLPTGPHLYGRVLGCLALAFGVYFAFAARDDNRDFLRSSIPNRLFVFVAFTIIALTAGEPMLILFGAADAVFAMWTWMALRKAEEA